jgi:hypothetical protein
LCYFSRRLLQYNKWARCVRVPIRNRSAIQASVTVVPGVGDKGWTMKPAWDILSSEIQPANDQPDGTWRSAETG